MKRSIYGLSVIMFFQFAAMGVNAQTTKQKIADRLYSKRNYFEAVGIYDELAKATTRKGKKGTVEDWEMLRKAAQCNVKLRQYDKANEWYSKLMANKQASKEDLYSYFESLRYVGNYAQADSLIVKLKALDPSNPLVSEYYNARHYYTALKKDSANIKAYSLPVNGGLGDFGPAFYDKGIVYASSRQQGTMGNERYAYDNSYFLNLYYTEVNGLEFKKPIRMPENLFDVKNTIGPVYFSPDRKKAYITVNRLESDSYDKDNVKLNLYTAQRAENGEWGKPQPFPYNSTDYSIGHACLSEDGQYLYYSSDMPGGFGGVDIWRSVKVGDGWGAPENMGKVINTSKDDMFPFIGQNGSLYFASKGHVGLGGFDLFESRKIPGQKTFMRPLNLGYPVNTQYDDFGLITESGEKSGYFSSDRNGYIDRILKFEINRSVINLSGTVRNQESGAFVSNTPVVIKNTTLGDSVIVYTDSLGKFRIPLVSDCIYEIKPMKTQTMEAVDPIIINSADKKYGGDFNIEVGAKEVFRTYIVKIIDANSSQPLAADARIQLTDASTNETMVLNTDSEGNIYIPINAADCDKIKQYFLVNKTKGYTPEKKLVELNIRCTGDSVGKVGKQISVQKNAVGVKFEVKDIYYDYNSAALRAASIQELEVLYEYLRDNPTVTVELSSHTDSRGSDSYNMQLSQKRAQMCMDYLVKTKGISGNRIVAKGYGESKPVNKCSNNVPCNEDDYQKNRRTEIKILTL